MLIVVAAAATSISIGDTGISSACCWLQHPSAACWHIAGISRFKQDIIGIYKLMEYVSAVMLFCAY